MERKKKKAGLRRLGPAQQGEALKKKAAAKETKRLDPTFIWKKFRKE